MMVCGLLNFLFFYVTAIIFNMEPSCAASQGRQGTNKGASFIKQLRQ